MMQIKACSAVNWLKRNYVLANGVAFLTHNGDEPRSGDAVGSTDGREGLEVV